MLSGLLCYSGLEKKFSAEQKRKEEKQWIMKS